MEWIKCSDRLPEESGRYNVFEIKEPHKHDFAAYDYLIACCGVNIAYYDVHNNLWSYSSFNFSICTPTHWMALPKSPIEN